MTDRTREPGRIDLGAIDQPADPLQAERVIAAAMSRIGADGDSSDDVVASIVTYSRPLLAAAAALLVVATGTLIVSQRRTEHDQPANVLATWAESSHVPTNGELLAAFQGYDR
jgi:hypothetical protein